MKLRLLLACSAVSLFGAFALSAQQAAPATDFHVKYSCQLPFLTQEELKQVISEAQSGEREAQYWLAMIHDEGNLVAKSHQQFIQWLNKSAEQGYAPAQELLEYTNSPRTERDNVKAEMWLLRGAAQGNADSQLWLGVAYEQDWFGTCDLQEAAKWYREAAEQGQPDAQTSLGSLYKDGDGVEQNYALAAEWYRKAADHVPDLGGAGQGRWHLAELYEEGLGVPKDLVQAYMWYSIQFGESNLGELRAKMTAAQIQEAQRMTEQWKKVQPEPQIPPDYK